jgi:hypothetical protein
VYEPEAAFIDLEEEFYSADYLMAWMGEACLQDYLKKRFGEEWFTKREAGEFLKGIWGEGERLSLEDLLRRLGHPSMDPEPLLRSFRQPGPPFCQAVPNRATRPRRRT